MYRVAYNIHGDAGLATRIFISSLVMARPHEGGAIAIPIERKANEPRNYRCYNVGCVCVGSG